MTHEQKQRFLSTFSRTFMRESAAEDAGITDAQARACLRRKDTRAALDAMISARLAGDILDRIRREYESMAFGADESIRPMDRIRALEQLRHLASETVQGDAPSLIIRCEYV